MRCKTCDYPLWNLTTRTCPECGESFYPSEYEFAANAVRFECPGCRQTYYGRGAKGHLEPRTFDCVQCRRRITMDEMVLQPAEGVDERNTLSGVVPWLRRRRGDRIGSWLRTVGMGLFNPVRLGRSLPSTAPIGQAWWFAIVTSLAIGLASAFPWVALFMIPFIAAAAGGGGGGPAAAAAATFFLAFPVAAVIGIFVSVGLWSLLSHGLLRMTGSTTGTLGRTVQAICYSSGANVFSGVPCIGGYFGWIWWVVSAVITVKEVQGVGGARATFAVASPPVVVVLAAIVVWFTSLAAMMALSAQGMAQAITAQNTAQVNAIQMALLASAQSPPQHGLELWLDGLLMPQDYVGWQTLTTTDDIPVGSTTLGSAMFANRLAQRKAVDDAVAALPAGVVAHRVGDFVFTYHGIDMTSPDPRLWLVVMTADPALAGTPTGTDTILVGTADGQVTTLTYRQLRDTELATQNRYRAGVGLAPLPDPALLLHRGTSPESSPDDAPMGPGEDAP